MEFAVLNNGVRIPRLGFGVFQIPREECEESVRAAIDVGYRLIDTAQSYFNEAEVGKAVAESGVPREEFFITTKVWIDNYGYEKTKQSIETSLRKLRTDYIDLVLLHQPVNDTYAAYRALECLYEEKKLRAIGVSNFAPDRLADIAAFNRIVPQVNQVEINPFFQQVEAQKNMILRHVQPAAWAPFGEGKNNIFSSPILEEIGSKYKKSAAQVILRWLMQRDIVTLAKSTHAARMKENFEIFDFSLSDEDMGRIAEMDTKNSMFFDHQSPETVDRFVHLIEQRRGLV
ncbi:MAG: aldo/keto reductase [Clostridiales bacterium]|nr:aldo/keto reductase [Clostridiales bacterium]